MKIEAKDIEYDIADVIIGRPHGFTVGQSHFYLYPITLAKMFLLKRQMDSLDINQKKLKANPFLEAMHLVKANRDICCMILAYHTTPNTRQDLYDNEAVESRKNMFAKEIEDEDLASLMIKVMTSDKTEEIISHYGLDEERTKLAKVIAIKRKHDKNTLYFCGKTMFGTFICQLKEMGYTDDEIIFERGFSYLRLMLADKMTSVHATDDELNEIPTEAGGRYADASDPANAQKILQAMKERGAGVS
jgi:hypothetical protein